MPAGMAEMMNDPEVAAAMSDPDVMAKLSACSTLPLLCPRQVHPAGPWHAPCTPLAPHTHGTPVR